MSDSLQPHGPYSPWNPGHNTGVGSLSLLQEISQPSNGTQVSHIADNSLAAEPPKILEQVAYPFFRGFSRVRNRTGISCIASGFFLSTELSREATIKKMRLRPVENSSKATSLIYKR